jgi:hypothetical protein
MEELDDIPIDPIDEELVPKSINIDKNFVDGCIFTPTSDNDICF